MSLDFLDTMFGKKEVEVVDVNQMVNGMTDGGVLVIQRLFKLLSVEQYYKDFDKAREIAISTAEQTTKDKDTNSLNLITNKLGQNKKVLGQQDFFSLETVMDQQADIVYKRSALIDILKPFFVVNE